MNTPRTTVMVLPVHRAGLASNPRPGRLICNDAGVSTFPPSMQALKFASEF
jgi:hypothetical protein